MQVLPFALAAYFSDWDWPSCLQIRCNRNEMSGQRLHIQGTSRSPAKLLLGKRCKYSPRKISPEKLTPCYEVPPAHMDAARHAEGDCEVMQNLRMRRHLAHRQFSCQSSTGKESGSQVEIPEVWTKIIIDNWEGFLFFKFWSLKSLDIGIGWKWLNSHVGRMIWR